MNGSQEYTGSKSPMTVVAWVLLVAALIWAIVATTVAAKRSNDLAQTRQELEKVRADADQQAMAIAAKEAELERRAQEAEQLRKTALDWTRQAQARIQQSEKQKAEAAKSKSTGSSSSSSKSSSGKRTSSSKSRR